MVCGGVLALFFSLYLSLVSGAAKQESAVNEVLAGMMAVFNEADKLATERADVLAKVSMEVQMHNCPSKGTGHAIVVNGKVGILVAPSVHCREVKPPTFIQHPYLNLAMFNGCPVKGKSALEISTFVNPEIGSTIHTFGYREYSALHKMFISGKNVFGCSQSGSTCVGEFLTQESIHPSISGGAVTTNCGYAGMVQHNRNNQTAILPGMVIRDFVVGNLDKMTDISTCKDLLLEKIKPATFANCNVPSAAKK